jgi:hypothetical protein
MIDVEAALLLTGWVVIALLAAVLTVLVRR